jgi:hypothetical protein
MDEIKQIDFFGNLVSDDAKLKIDKQKRNWENRFQRWSNNQFHNSRYDYGTCGYGSMCDYCEDMTYGRPCVRALNEMLRDKNIVLDYTKATFEEVWNGKFKQRKAD